MVQFLKWQTLKVNVNSSNHRKPVLWTGCAAALEGLVQMTEDWKNLFLHHTWRISYLKTVTYWLLEVCLVLFQHFARMTWLVDTPGITRDIYKWILLLLWEKIHDACRTTLSYSVLCVCCSGVATLAERNPSHLSYQAVLNLGRQPWPFMPCPKKCSMPA